MFQLEQPAFRFLRWIAAKCCKPCRFVTVRNKCVRFLSEDVVSQSINVATMATSIVSLSGVLDDSIWWFCLSKTVESLPFVDLALCLISDLLYCFPHNRKAEKEAVKSYLRKEGNEYTDWADAIQ